MAASRCSYGSMIDSILTKWIASMTQAKKTRSLEGGSDEAARLFPQQRGLPGPYSLEPEGFERRPPAAPSAQGRAARPLLSGDQSARAGADAAGRPRRDRHPVAGHHRM